MVNIVLVTGNDNKRKEIEEIIGDKATIINIKIDLPEIQSISVKEVIRKKIEHALMEIQKEEIFNLIKKKFNDKNIIVETINDFILICEDTGLYIKNMNGFPGALIKFYYDSIGNKGIVERDHGSNATVMCVIGIVSKGEIKSSISGKVKGKIAKYNSGNNGFGWDASFIPQLKNTTYEEYNGKSYAEIPEHTKNKLSHRYVAFTKLKHTLI